MKVFGREVSATSPRWPATRFALRLGIIAATLTGVALAFHVGGRDAYTVPMSWLLSFPTNLLMYLIPGFNISSSGPGSEWSLSHVAACAAIVGNWTLIGVAVDALGWRPTSTPNPTPLGKSDPATLREALADPLLAEFEALERAVKVREDRGERSGAVRHAA